MTACLAPLRDDEIDPSLLERDGFLDRRRGPYADASRLANEIEGRDPEGEAEDGNPLLGDDYELPFEHPCHRGRRRRLGIAETELGEIRAERVRHRVDHPVWRLRCLFPREEVDGERAVRERARLTDRLAQCVGR